MSLWGPYLAMLRMRAFLGAVAFGRGRFWARPMVMMHYAPPVSAAPLSVAFLPLPIAQPCRLYRGLINYRLGSHIRHLPTRDLLA